jgi:hypothetical protein
MQALEVSKAEAENKLKEMEKRFEERNSVSTFDRGGVSLALMDEEQPADTAAERFKSNNMVSTDVVDGNRGAHSTSQTPDDKGKLASRFQQGEIAI